MNRRQKRITLRILFWECLALCIPAALAIAFSKAHIYLKRTGTFLPLLCIGLLVFLFCIYKIHALYRMRTQYRRGEWTLADLDDISGIDFEALTCDILASNGFTLAESTRASGDFGVDVLAWRDGISFAIQCKRYQSDVGLEAVQQVYAGRAFYECHVAMVLTNQYFTPAAIKLADKIGVVLWDRDMLEQLL